MAIDYVINDLMEYPPWTFASLGARQLPLYWQVDLSTRGDKSIRQRQLLLSIRNFRRESATGCRCIGCVPPL